MSLFKTILVGDLHLEKNLSQGKVGIGSQLNSRINDQFNLLEWILDQALEINANNIIITGDIFEEPKPSPLIITLFIEWLKKCQANSIQIHIIMGNHDTLRSGYVYYSPLDIISELELENINVYKNINTIVLGTIAFTFLPFRDRKSFGVNSNQEALSLLRESLVYELSSIPLSYKKIVVGHLAIEGSIPVGDEIDDITNELFCPIDMFNGYDYVWMGHVHKPQVMNKNHPYVAHIGSMDISNFLETDHKKHLVIINEDDDNFFNKKILPTRPLKKVSLTLNKDIKDTTNFVIDFLQNLNFNWDKSIVKIEIILENESLPNIDRSVIEKYLYSKGVFHIVNISESRKCTLIRKTINENDNILTTKIDIKSAIKTYADSYIDDEKLRSQFLETSFKIYNQYKCEKHKE